MAIETSQIKDQLFIWPIDCVVDDTCKSLGLPDPDKNGVAYNGQKPGYTGHQGTDIGIDWIQMAQGIDIFAAADGIVEFVFDGKYDRCTKNSDHEDCQDPNTLAAGQTQGTTVCTDLGPYCRSENGTCYWCFAGGNVVVIKHPSQTKYFATRYDHFKKNSIIVEVGQQVKQGDRIGEAGSAGRSTGPHLHFEVWGQSYYDVIDPWQEQLWQDNPVDQHAIDLKDQRTQWTTITAVIIGVVVIGVLLFRRRKKSQNLKMIR